MNWIQSEVFQTIVRRLLTTAATALVAHGAIKGGQEGQFVEMGLGVAIWVATGIVTYLKSKQHDAVNQSVAVNKGSVPATVTAAAQPTNIIGMKTDNGLPN